MMKRVLLNGKYDMWLPDHRADRPEWFEKDGWEKIRIAEMVSHISESDVVFDIGVEVGDITGIISKYTNCDLVMIEPNKKCWPSIAAIWEKNELREPLFFYGGFVSDKTTKHQPDFDDTFLNSKNEIVAATGFSQLCDPESIPQITLDDLCDKLNLYPTVITMDCEGSEFSVLHGAEKVLRNNSPIIFMSVHPVMMWENYKHEVSDMLKFMKGLGYKWKCIDYELHETHLTFYHE